MNISDLISGSIGNAAASSISSKLNIEPGKAKWLIAAAVPLMIAAINYNAKNKNQEANINKALDDHSGGVLSNLAGALMGNSNNDDGNKIVNHIFGANTQMVTQNLSEKSGLSSEQVAGTLSMLAPIVMSFLGKEKQSRQTSGGGVADLLGSLMSGNSSNKKSAGGNLLGGLLGNVLGGNKPKPKQTKSAGGLGPLADLAGDFFNQNNNSQKKSSTLETLAGMFMK